jgi:methylmalonyl-CoA mutase N-terminal domain/subunit
VAWLQSWRAHRDTNDVAKRLDAVRTSAAGTDNLLPPMKLALLAGATVGEVSEALVDVFGRYRPGV